VIDIYGVFIMKKAPKQAKVSARKRMAMGEMGEKFGTRSYQEVHGGKPVSSGQGSTGKPAIGEPVKRGKGMHPAQAAPKH
jgi:hypothetical protein